MLYIYLPYCYIYPYNLRNTDLCKSQFPDFCSIKTLSKLFSFHIQGYFHVKTTLCRAIISYLALYLEYRRNNCSRKSGSFLFFILAIFPNKSTFIRYFPFIFIHRIPYRRFSERNLHILLTNPLYIQIIIFQFLYNERIHIINQPQNYPETIRLNNPMQTPWITRSSVLPQ